ncbi:MAG: aldehyde dehydrogenase, partial [Nitratireductor sp.]
MNASLSPLPQVEAFLATPQGARIGDARVAAASRLAVVDPSTEVVIAEVAAGGVAEIDAAVEAA